MPSDVLRNKKNHTNPALDLDLFVGARMNTEVFGIPSISGR